MRATPGPVGLGWPWHRGWWHPRRDIPTSSPVATLPAPWPRHVLVAAVPPAGGKRHGGVFLPIFTPKRPQWGFGVSRGAAGAGWLHPLGRSPRGDSGRLGGSPWEEPWPLVVVENDPLGGSPWGRGGWGQGGQPAPRGGPSGEELAVCRVLAALPARSCGSAPRGAKNTLCSSRGCFSRYHAPKCTRGVPAVSHVLRGDFGRGGGSKGDTGAAGFGLSCPFQVLDLGLESELRPPGPCRAACRPPGSRPPACPQRVTSREPLRCCRQQGPPGSSLAQIPQARHPLGTRVPAQSKVPTRHRRSGWRNLPVHGDSSPSPWPGSRVWGFPPRGAPAVPVPLPLVALWSPPWQPRSAYPWL